MDRYNASKCGCASRFTVSENNSKFCIVSKELDKVEKIKVDGYLDDSAEHRKCDYLFVYTDNSGSTCIFVELKGKDVARAITQLQQTIESFYREGFLTGKRVRGAIVHTQHPGNTGSVRKAKQLLDKFVTGKIRDFRLENRNRQMNYDPVSDKITG